MSNLFNILILDSISLTSYLIGTINIAMSVLLCPFFINYITLIYIICIIVAYMDTRYKRSIENVLLKGYSLFTSILTLGTILQAFKVESLVIHIVVSFFACFVYSYVKSYIKRRYDSKDIDVIN